LEAIERGIKWTAQRDLVRPRAIAPVASSALSVNVFTAPGKPRVGERPRPLGEAFGFDPATSTLDFGEYDAVLVDAMTTVLQSTGLH
jgi:hypothetical protein